MRIWRVALVSVWVASCGGTSGNKPALDMGIMDSAMVGTDMALGIDMPAVDLTPTIPTTVNIGGGVAKGPFILGSPVTIGTLDQAGNSTGRQFATQTNDQIGNFSLTFDYSGPISVQASGFYYNEILATLSQATITLNALASISTKPSQNVYVNLLTHLTANRVRTLLANGTGLDAAIIQAERELRTNLQIGGPSFDPHASGSQLNMLGGDNDQSAYIFALSSVLTEAALDSPSSGSPEAKLQQFLNTMASDFAPNGTVPSSTRAAVTSAQQIVQPSYVVNQLTAYVKSVNSTAVVPDVNRALDSDLDGIPNKLDNCALVPNPSQNPISDAVCSYQIASYRGTINLTTGTQFVVTGDFNGDGFNDVLATRDPYAVVWLNDGTGRLLAPNVLNLDTLLGVAAGTNLQMNAVRVGDLNNDGKLDLAITGVVGTLNPQGPAYQKYQLSYLPGDGSGGFATAVTAIPIPPGPTGPPPPTTDLYYGYTDFAVYDTNGDKLNDIVGIINPGPYGPKTTVVAVAIAKVGGGWNNPALISTLGNQALRIVALNFGDINGDGIRDAIVTSWYDNTSTTSQLDMLVSTGTGLSPLGPTTFQNLRLFDAQAGDIDGDGKVDIVTTAYSPSAGINQVAVSFGDGAGVFGNSISVPISLSGNALTFIPLIGSRVADVTGDGKADIIVTPGVIASLGRTMLPSPTFISFGRGTSPPQANAEPFPLADLNNDGRPDIVAGGVWGIKTVLLNPTNYHGW